MTNNYGHKISFNILKTDYKHFFNLLKFQNCNIIFYNLLKGECCQYKIILKINKLHNSYK